MKIIISGFPHCGTTILRTIIGRIKNVYEHLEEVKMIDQKMIDQKKEHIVIKSPFLLHQFMKEKYDDYIKIFIIRDPYYVYSSLNRRYQYNIKNTCSFDVYLQKAKIFLKYQEKTFANVYCIKYEEIFENNFQKLRNIFDQIELDYTDDIFITNDNNNNMKNKKPSERDHDKFRKWQINQQLRNMNQPYKLDLKKEQIQKISNSEIVQKLGYCKPIKFTPSCRSC